MTDQVGQIVQVVSKEEDKVSQVAGANSISEVLRRLDFLNAVKDIRRFNYICKLLHLLITQNLTSLSGCGSKVLFSMLERVASQDHQEVYCWGRPLGSTLLWERHFRTLERICRVASGISFTPRPDPGPPRLTDLPAELMREILLRLTDPRDLRAAGQACRTMDNLLHERHVWRQLVRFHFTQTQIATARAQYLRPGGAVAGANSISEVLRRLDFLNAVKDIRRFNYICKLLHLLITQNLTSLSGCGSKVLFSMLERVASQGTDVVLEYPW
ncbi:FBXO32 [Cordylochernes scorpioides]|uniref:FBXO32 n=1 Tax=Cordylochernes scorpioides TaxID=51811 RepID=A0ABY6KEZ8_9ARAC|nr:FBXO32 [Cordylochernes scorpioides]